MAWTYKTYLKSLLCLLKSGQPIKFLWVSLSPCEMEVAIAHLAGLWWFMEKNTYPYLTKWNIKEEIQRFVVGYRFSHGKNYICLCFSFLLNISSYQVSTNCWSGWMGTAFIISLGKANQPVQSVQLQLTFSACFSLGFYNISDFSPTLLAVLSKDGYWRLISF